MNPRQRITPHRAAHLNQRRQPQAVFAFLRLSLAGFPHPPLDSPAVNRLCSYSETVGIQSEDDRVGGKPCLARVVPPCRKRSIWEPVRASDDGRIRPAMRRKSSRLRDICGAPERRSVACGYFPRSTTGNGGWNNNSTAGTGRANHVPKLGNPQYHGRVPQAKGDLVLGPSRTDRAIGTRASRPSLSFFCVLDVHRSRT